MFEKIFGKKKKENLTIGILGEVNAGKTTLANRISRDFTGKEMGKVSPIPHETREIKRMDNMAFKVNGSELNLNVVDTPGIASSIDYTEFIRHGLTRKQSIERAKEATKGVIKAIQSLSQLDAAIVVVDSSKPPFNQVNWTIVGNLQDKKIPMIVAANKADLPDSNARIVQELFDGAQNVISISALTGDGVTNLYKAIAAVE
ncbi:MAG: Era-like GTP-binding protein [Candidatus Hodarchaeales archaeon]|jgi:small GTP-binding protein